jgi:hypothetical protein
MGMFLSMGERNENVCADGVKCRHSVDPGGDARVREALGRERGRGQHGFTVRDLVPARLPGIFSPGLQGDTVCCR